MSALKNIVGYMTDAVNETVERLAKDCNRVLAITAAEEAIRTHDDRKRGFIEQESGSQVFFCFNEAHYQVACSQIYGREIEGWNY